MDQQGKFSQRSIIGMHATWIIILVSILLLECLIPRVDAQNHPREQRATMCLKAGDPCGHPKDPKCCTGKCKEGYCPKKPTPVSRLLDGW